MTPVAEAKLSTWAPDGAHQDSVIAIGLNSSQAAVGKLDGTATTDLSLSHCGGASLLVSGGPDMFVVIWFAADQRSWTAGSDRTGADVVLNCGGQAGEFPATIVADCAAACRAIDHFITNGTRAPDLVWIED